MTDSMTELDASLLRDARFAVRRIPVENLAQDDKNDSRSRLAFFGSLSVAVDSLFGAIFDQVEWRSEKTKSE